MRDKKYYATRAAEIVKSIQYVAVATATKGGKPWNTPVYYSFDEDLNFYWHSSPDSQHSKNIAENSKVFLVVYDSRTGSKEGEGVYVEAEVVEVGADEFEHAIEVFGQRRSKPINNVARYGKDGSQRLYKAVPMRIFINDDERDDDGNFIRDYRVRLNISDVRARLGEM